MKGLAASNLGWTREDEGAVLDDMLLLGFTGLEVAPSKFVVGDPFDSKGVEKAVSKVRGLAERGLTIASLQSIWFGRSERLFGSEDERLSLRRHTLKAIDFAEAIGCHHVVLGAPKNRALRDGDQFSRGVETLFTCAEYALDKDVVIGVEPNPRDYGTNFLNNTRETFEFVSWLHHPSLKVNFDLGAHIMNGEELSDLEDTFSSVSHVHISSPWLKGVEEGSQLHGLAALIQKVAFDGWVSVETLEPGTEELRNSLEVTSRVFIGGRN